MNDNFNLERFKQAQDTIYHRVVAELEIGHKTSHWMWFIFPQVAGLGLSAMARKYAIGDLAEAKAYLKQPLLYGRLIECCELVLANKNKNISQVLGSPDDIKLKSSMTLFHKSAPQQAIFGRVLNQFYQGDFDQITLNLLQQNG